MLWNYKPIDGFLLSIKIRVSSILSGLARFCVRHENIRLSILFIRVEYSLLNINSDEMGRILRVFTRKE